MRACLALLCAALAGSAGAASPGLVIPGADVRPLSYSDLPGWQDDDHAAALATFRVTCPALVAGGARSAVPPPGGLVDACRDALATPGLPADARAFFERRFTPAEIVPASGAGFLTGYFEPELPGSLAPSAAFPSPLLALPDDLLAAPPGRISGRLTENGLEPYPDRAAIEDGALGPAARPLVHLADPVATFVVEVQGSARIRLEDGRALRLAYAGRNGHPYTSVGRLVVERTGLPPSALTADALSAWLRANPGEARTLMRRNRSFVFFRLSDAPSDEGPLGAAGVPVTAGRSLAVDRALWPYGLPIWLDGTAGGDGFPLRRLAIAQDTGGAIVGPARGDLFVGSGEAAGREAGLMRARVRFVVLLPTVDAPAAERPTSPGTGP